MARRALDDLVEARNEHFARNPECGGEPLCPGPIVVDAVELLRRSQSGMAWMLLIVAVHELATARAEVEALKKQNA